MEQTSVDRKSKLAPAIATSWNSADVYVFCPYCKNIHHHGTGSANRWPPGTDIVNSRAPHCEPMQIPDKHGRLVYHFNEVYQILYPFEQHQATRGYGFEIDAKDGLFRTVGLDIPEQEQDIEDTMKAEIKTERDLLKENGRGRPHDLSDMLRDINLERRGSDQERIYSEDAATFNDLWNYCVRGELSGFVSLFQSLPGKERWLHWTYDTSTLLHYAAMEGHDRVVRYLLDQGADVNAVDARKRTPLMEAAIWGRTLTVHHLLRHKADQTMKDMAGYTALGLAKGSTRNTIERKIIVPSLKLDIRECIADRENIAALLGHTHVPERTRGDILISNPSLVSAWKSKDPQVIGFNTQVSIAECKVPYLTKTLAVLDRGAPYPRVSVMSGWANTFDDNQLNAACWTNEVLDICRSMGHELPEHRRDQGTPGRFYACHAEKQLMAYFLRKHVLESYDYQVIFGEDRLDKASGQKVRDVSSAECKKTPKLDIFVSTPPCDDCKSWKGVIEQKFNVRFEFHPC